MELFILLSFTALFIRLSFTELFISSSIAELCMVFSYVELYILVCWCRARYFFAELYIVFSYVGLYILAYLGYVNSLSYESVRVGSCTWRLEDYYVEDYSNVIILSTSKVLCALPFPFALIHYIECWQHVLYIYVYIYMYVNSKVFLICSRLQHY